MIPIPISHPHLSSTAITLHDTMALTKIIIGDALFCNNLGYVKQRLIGVFLQMKIQCSQSF
jgi:hypothetical protein